MGRGGDVDCTDLAQERVFVDLVMNLLVPYNVRNLLTS